MKKETRYKILDFTILALRWYLAFYMIDYGWSKMTGGQFGIHDPEILNRPLKEVDKFYLAWHLFSLSKSFNIIVGMLQITGAIMIVINRTAIIGALFLLPVLGQIFLIDIAFTTNLFGTALPIRIGIMILSAIAILVYYKDRMVTAWITLTNEVSTRCKYKWWIYILLPIIGFGMDFFFAVLSWPVKQLINWIIK